MRQEAEEAIRQAKAQEEQVRTSARDGLLQGLQDLNSQRKALEENIEFLQREEAKLKADVEKVKKGEEIKPKVESFIERVQDLREEILIVIGNVAPVPNTQISQTLETHLRDIYGDDIEIV